MKKILLTLVLPLFVLRAYCQCNTYFNFKEGAEYELTHYSDKDKVTGKSRSQVLSIKDDGGVLTAAIKGTFYNAKDKELSSVDFEYICDHGILKMDLKRFIPEDMYGNGSDIRFEMKGDYLEIPKTLEVGQTLKDGMIEGKMIMEGNPVMANMTMTIKILNRKVESQETVTTPAGTFSCFKISYDFESSSKVMGINNNVTMHGIDYVADGVGVVKVESYNKKGELAGYSLLTAYK